jgi:hypothetical protein
MKMVNIALSRHRGCKYATRRIPYAIYTRLRGTDIDYAYAILRFITQAIRNNKDDVMARSRERCAHLVKNASVEAGVNGSEMRNFHFVSMFVTPVQE